MSKRPFVSRFIDTSNQLLLRYRQRRQVRPDYAVPAGAQPGDIHLEPATFRTRTYEVPAQQGYLIVAEDPQAPTGRLLSLPIIRTEAEVADPGLPVYWFTTGPGSSNMLAAPPDWLLRRHPITILGYRGVDGTVRLDSPEIVRAQKGQGHDLHSAASLAAFRQAVAAAVARWQREGIELKHYGFAAAVADVESARAALGDEQILLLGEGYGGRIAQWYAATYPEHVMRLALLGPSGPDGLTWQPAEVTAVLDRYATLYERSGRHELAAMMQQALGQMPRNWRLFPIDPGKVRFMAFSLLFDRKNGALLLDTLRAAADGDPAGLAMMTILYDVVINSSAQGAVGDLLAKSYLDEPLAETELGPYGLGSPLSQLLEAGRSAWPLQQPGNLPAIPVPALLLNGNLDIAAPAAEMQAKLLPRLPDHHQITLRDAGHLNDLWRLQPEGVEKLLGGFLADGTVNEEALRHEAIDFTVSQNLAAMMRLLWRVLWLLLGSAVACGVLAALWQYLG
ncbi:MAG: alpha/beta fold hydrolase [Anaerolineales bacterium]|nr:alpha/beta fold hydrolase [Anaerolineales bacterium]MCB0017480.1 alpha/beta fold hydrolase [Anaerolineales bacterium]MCB0028884.1 alpha/beta fold hydrolase [Anaerolineales bacterium]